MEFAPKEWWEKSKSFLRETKSESNKVAWPGRQEVIATTGVVLGATIIFGVYLWLCDLVFYRAIDFIFTQFGAGI